MKTKQELGLAALFVFGLVLIMAVNTYLQPRAENRHLNKAVFYVA